MITRLCPVPRRITRLVMLLSVSSGFSGAAELIDGKPVGLGLYVSTQGDDAKDGRSPRTAFLSLVRARDEIRRLKSAGPLPAGGVVVEILGGKHVLKQSLELLPVDSGTEASPVIYRAYQNQPAELLGGRIISPADFEAVSDPEILKRLDTAAVGKVRRISISKAGLVHAGPFPDVFDDSGGIFELFWNGKRLLLSRWPNEGWTTMKAVTVNGDKTTPGEFEYRDDRPGRWLKNPDIWLKGQWRVGWEDPAIKVAKIDTTRRVITFSKGISLGIGNKYKRPAGDGKEPWCAMNLLEEIDTPGEWAIDFKNRRLYLWPPDGAGELSVSQLDKPMMALKGAAHVSIQGLTFECSLGDGIVIENAESNVVAGCTFRNLSGNGVILDGYRSGVKGCDMDDLGAGCVRISGGDPKTLTASGNFVVNNHLHDYGKLKAMYSAAVDVGFGGASNAVNHKAAVGVRVANNLIHDGPRDAVLVSGQDNLFELNEIYRCGFASADVGAFYSWLDWTIRGVVIRHNYIHDTVGGVNPDDGASGSLVYGNIIAGPRTGVWIASGPDHTITHNIFVKAEGPVFGMDDRGVARGYATNPKLQNRLKELNPAGKPWSARFPETVKLLESHPELPLRTKFTGNLVVIQSGDAVNLKMKKENLANPALFDGSGNFVTAEDPGFVDVANGNLALRPDSLAFKKIPGFEPIPFGKIGLFKDAWRRLLPDDTTTRRTKGNLMFKKEDDKNFGT